MFTEFIAPVSLPSTLTPFTDEEYAEFEQQMDAVPGRGYVDFRDDPDGSEWLREKIEAERRRARIRLRPRERTRCRREFPSRTRLG